MGFIGRSGPVKGLDGGSGRDLGGRRPDIVLLSKLEHEKKESVIASFRLRGGEILLRNRARPNVPSGALTRRRLLISIRYRVREPDSTFLKRARHCEVRSLGPGRSNLNISMILRQIMKVESPQRFDKACLIYSVIIINQRHDKSCPYISIIPTKI